MPISDTQLQSAIKATAGKDGIINTATERKAFLLALGATKSTNNGVGENITRLKLDGDNASLSALESAGIKNKGYQSGSLTGGDLEELFGPSGFNFEQLKAKLGDAKADTPKTADTKTTDTANTAMDEDAANKYLGSLVSKLTPEAQEKFKAAAGDDSKPFPDEQINALLAANNLQFKDGYKLPDDAKSDGVALANALKANTVAKTADTKTDSRTISQISPELLQKYTADGSFDYKDLASYMVDSKVITAEEAQKLLQNNGTKTGSDINQVLNKVRDALDADYDSAKKANKPSIAELINIASKTSNSFPTSLTYQAAAQKAATEGSIMDNNNPATKFITAQLCIVDLSNQLLYAVKGSKDASGQYVATYKNFQDAGLVGSAPKALEKEQPKTGDGETTKDIGELTSSKIKEPLPNS